MQKIIWVCELSEKKQKEIVRKIKAKLEEEGIYTPDEIEGFLQDALDSKIVDLEDALK